MGRAAFAAVLVTPCIRLYWYAIQLTCTIATRRSQALLHSFYKCYASPSFSSYTDVSSQTIRMSPVLLLFNCICLKPLWWMHTMTRVRNTVFNMWQWLNNAMMYIDAIPLIPEVSGLGFKGVRERMPYTYIYLVSKSCVHTRIFHYNEVFKITDTVRHSESSLQ